MRLYLTFNENNPKHQVILDYLNNKCVDGKAEILDKMYKIASGINIYSNAPIEEQILTGGNSPLVGKGTEGDIVNAPIEDKVGILGIPQDSDNAPQEEQIDTSGFEDFFN